MHVHLHIHIHMHIHVHMHIHMYIYICIYVYVYDTVYGLYGDHPLECHVEAIILGHHGTTSHGHFSLSLSPGQTLDLHSWQVEVLNYPAK